MTTATEADPRTRMPVTVETITLRDGTRVPCAIAGPRRYWSVPLVLLHGITDSWRSFEPILAELPPGVTAVAPTLRGHGDADRPTNGYRLEQLAADVVDVLDHVGVPTAAVVGHSLGASIAQQLAVDHPSRVAALVLAGGFSDPAANDAVRELVELADALDEPVDPAMVADFQHGTIQRSVPAGFMEMVVDESLKVPARVWRAAARGLAGPTPRQRDIAAPTTLIWGDHDAFVPRADQRRLLDRIPDCRLEIYAGTGHAVHWEQPRRFVDDLVEVVRHAAQR